MYTSIYNMFEDLDNIYSDNESQLNPFPRTF